MRFFLDNNLSRRQAAALNSLSDRDGHEVRHLQEIYPKQHNVADDVWLTDLGNQKNWVVVCGDPRILRIPHLRKAWRDSGLTAFFLLKPWMNQPFWVQSHWLVKTWPTIVSFAAEIAPGAGFEVPKPPGKLVQLRA